MKQITINLYEYHELSPAAQRHAWENSRYNYSDTWENEYRTTLKQFESYFNVSVYRFSVDSYNYTFDFHTYADDALQCIDNPLRLAKYLHNNYYQHITLPKRYRKNKKYRNSKIFKDTCCPLTGFFADDDILKPIFDCMSYNQQFNCYDDLITDCLCRFFTVWSADIEYTTTQEYFADFCENNQILFTENGTEWRGC